MVGSAADHKKNPGWGAGVEVTFGRLASRRARNAPGCGVGSGRRGQSEGDAHSYQSNDEDEKLGHVPFRYDTPLRRKLRAERGISEVSARMPVIRRAFGTKGTSQCGKEDLLRPSPTCLLKRPVVVARCKVERPRSRASFRRRREFLILKNLKTVRCGVRDRTPQGLVSLRR